MKRRKTNVLMKKLEMLNTQDYSDDISWSSSDNSDCENKSNSTSLRSISNSHRKAKRKRKFHTNLSSLDVSVINPSDTKNQTSNDKSPISSKYSKDVSVPQSPLLKPKLLAYKNDINIPNTPILNNKVVNNRPENKSPILVLKHRSIAVSSNVKKKLLYEIDRNAQKGCNTDDIFNKNLESNNHTIQVEKENEPNIETVLNRTGSSSSESSLKVSGVMGKHVTKLDLMKKVQSYFDSHFSSDGTSQHSISECETVTRQNTPKSSDDYEISNSLSQTKCMQVTREHDDCIKNNETGLEKRKKIKYKKDGLAYRLNNLLKKQDCNISLWQHEKYLASNSNFIIPKSEYTGFRIKRVTFKYNCCLIEGRDLNDDDYLLLINACYVNSTCVVAPDHMLKLYEPYNVINLNDISKVIVNVCKFECVPIKM